MKAFRYSALALMLGIGGLLLTACNDEDDNFGISTTPSVASVATGSAEVTAVSAVVSAEVQGLIGLSPASYQVGVCYSTDPDGLPASGTKVVGSLVNSVIKTTLTDLETNVKYYYMPYVTLQGRVTYYSASVGEFLTTAAKLTSLPATDVTYASATLGAEVAGAEDVPVAVACGVKLGLTPDAEALKAGYDVASAEPLGGTDFTLRKSGLLPATTYYGLPYIKLGSAYVYGDVLSFTTEAAEFEYVDLGLSVLWATKNVGAETPEEVGGLMGYGDPTGLVTSDELDDYADADIYNSARDVAHAIGAGRLPKADDVRELLNACTTERFTAEGGAEVVRVTGPNGNSILLPVADYWTGSADGQYASTLSVGSTLQADAELVSAALAVRPVKKAPAPFVPSLLCGEESKTWYLDLDADGQSFVFAGPMYFYGTDDCWTSVSDGDAVTGDSWAWEADWAGNSWLCPAADYGSMTFYADGRVSVNGTEGTYSIDEEAHTITFSGVELLHMSNYDGAVNSFTTALPILSLTEEGVQIGAIRTDEPCLLSFNFISAEAYAEQKNKTSFIPSLLYGEESKTWYLDLDEAGNSFAFVGPMYYYGMDDSWETVFMGQTVNGDSWSWEADWVGNQWICSAADYGSMTFYADGRVSVNGIEGTYAIDETSHVITFTGVELLHMSNYDGAVYTFAESLPILSLTEEGLQIAATRIPTATDGECLLSFNFVSADVYIEHLKQLPMNPTFLHGGESKTWQLDLDSNGNSFVFAGPMYFYGLNDCWESIFMGQPVSGDTWSWEADWADGNQWICDAADYGTMTFYADGRVDVNGTEGSYAIDEATRTITFTGVELLHMPNYDGAVNSFTTALPILSLTGKGLQVGAVRTADPCLLSFNFISAKAYSAH